MASITRKEARELLFCLLFETQFGTDKSAQEIYTSAKENREIPDNAYIEACYFGINDNSALLDAVISKYAKGWSAERLSKVSRSVIRLAVYEILFVKDIPANVSVSEAVELSKKYGEDKARSFVNGVLSAIVKDVASNGTSYVISLASEADAECDNASEIASDKAEEN